MSREFAQDHSQFKSELSDLLGLTTVDSVNRLGDHKIIVNRIANQEEILAAVRRLLAAAPDGEASSD